MFERKNFDIYKLDDIRISALKAKYAIFIIPCLGLRVDCQSFITFLIFRVESSRLTDSPGEKYCKIH